MRWVLVVLVVAGCGGRKEAAPEPPARVETVRPREQGYLDKIEALKRLIKDGEIAASTTAARELMDDHRIDADGLVVVATAYQVVGNGEEALRAAKAATEKDPNNAAAWIAVGAAQRTLGYFSDAIGALERALALDPTSRAARFNLAGIAADKGEHDKARRELTTLVEADPDDFETRYLLATTYLAAKEIGPAKAQLARIVERFPQHFRAQRTLAALAWAEGDYPKAFQRATIAARLEADDPETMRLLDGSFYIVVAARLTCAAGPRPWPADAVVATLTQLERDQGLDGSASFLDLDARFGDDPTVQARIAKAATCAVPPPGPDAGTLREPTDAGP